MAAQPDLSPEQKLIDQANKTTIRTPVLSPDGRFVALIETDIWVGDGGFAYNPKGSRIQIWEVASGRLLEEKHTPANEVPQGAFSADGSKFLCYGMYRRFNGEEFVDGKNHIRLWATPSGKSLAALELGETDEIERLIFTPDGKQLMGQTHAPGKYVTVKTWDADTGKVLHSKARKLDPWDAETWEVRGKYIFGAYPIWSDGRRITSELRIWSLPGLEVLHTIETEPGILQYLAISPDGKRIAFKNDLAKRALEGIQLWDVEGKASVSLTIPTAERGNNINSLEFTSDSQTLVGSGMSLADMVIELASSIVGNAQITKPSFPINTGVVVNIYLWDAGTGALKRTVKYNHSLSGREGGAYHISLLPDGKRFIAFLGNEKIELRSLEDGTLIRTFAEKD